MVYSPKISEDLIPDLYTIAKTKRVPMTQLANDIISDAIRKIKAETQVVGEKAEVEKEVYLIEEEKIT